MNLLSRKIKDIKRELTAMKTAHARGLGNVIIYRRNVDVDPTGHQTGAHYLYVTIEFDRRFSSYPFAQIYPKELENGDYTMEIVGHDYSNGGYTMIAKLLWIYEEGTTSFTVESTAPTTSVNYSWSS